MFKAIAYAGLIAATAAGGHFAIGLAQNFEAQQMALYQSLATPQAVADDGTQWTEVQQPQQ